jgi:hypothetical protein
MSEDLIKKYKLTEEQTKIYAWLKSQNLNTDDQTLCYWVKKYPSRRIQEVVNFGNTRKDAGQNIRNMGGWVQKFLKTGQAVVDDNCKTNKEFSLSFAVSEKWNDLKIYEKYVKDIATGDDLSLNMDSKDFKRCLEALYQKNQLYK